MYYLIETGYLNTMQIIRRQFHTPSLTTLRAAAKANLHAVAARPFTNAKGETASYSMCHELNSRFSTLNENGQYRRMTSICKELAQ